MTQVPKYTVCARTPKGDYTIEVPTFQGEDAAARRAVMCLASHGKGDLDTIEVLMVTPTT